MGRFGSSAFRRWVVFMITVFFPAVGLEWSIRHYAWQQDARSLCVDAALQTRRLGMAGTTRDKFFDAVNESYDALLTAVEAAEARGHKLSNAVIDEARRGEKEMLTLAQKWVGDPTSVFDNLEAMMEVQARAQQRRLEFARDVLGGAGEFGTDVRDALRRVVRANAKAGEATAEAAQEVAHKAYTRVRGGKEAEIESGGPKHTKATKVPVAAGASTNSGEAADS